MKFLEKMLDKKRQFQAFFFILIQDKDLKALDRYEENIIGKVYDRYKQFTGIELSRLTHAPGSPWASTYKSGEFSVVISNDIIQDHYKQKALQAQEQ